MGLILSTSKQFFLLFLFISGCSSFKLEPIVPQELKKNDSAVKVQEEKKQVEEKLEKKELSDEVSEEKKPDRKVEKYIAGPQSLGNGDFVDMTAKYGLAGVEGVHFYAVDFSLDGHTDLVILSDFFSTPTFYRFLPRRKTFIKEKRSFFKTAPFASFLNFSDLNNDGILDLIVGVLNQKSELTKRPIRIYKGLKRKKGIFFEEVKDSFKEATIFPVTTIITFDHNLDGHLDLMVGNWFDHNTKKFVPNRLYLGKNFKFLDISNLLPQEHDYSRSQKSYPNAKPTQGLSICDLDKDGFSEVLVSNGLGYANQMLFHEKNRSTGEIKYNDLASLVGFSEDLEGKGLKRGGGNSFFAKCLDYNNDGIVDIISGELFHSYSAEMSDKSAVLTGKTLSYPPAFIRSEYIRDGEALTWSQADRRAVVFDYNNDGLQDILIDNSGFPPSTRLILFKQADDHAYDDVAKDTGVDILNPSGTVYLDINRDGKMDFITGQTSLRAQGAKKRIYLFQNSSRSKGSAYRIHLRGTQSNRDGIGAMITISTQNHKYWRYVEYNSGWLPSQNEKGIHFAVREGDKLKEITVLWPSLSNGRPKEVIYKSFKPAMFDLTLYENGKIR